MYGLAVLVQERAAAATCASFSLQEQGELHKILTRSQQKFNVKRGDRMEYLLVIALIMQSTCTIGFTLILSKILKIMEQISKPFSAQYTYIKTMRYQVQQPLAPTRAAYMGGAPRGAFFMPADYFAGTAAYATPREIQFQARRVGQLHVQPWW